MRVLFIINLLAILVVSFGVLAVNSIAHAESNLEKQATQELTKGLPDSTNVDPDPLVLTTPETFIYSTDQDEWLAIGNKAIQTTSKTIILEIQGYGGYLNMGNKFFRLVDEAQASGKKVVMEVIGPSYSLHAFMVCFANEVDILPGASVMFHPPYNIDSYLFGMISVRNTQLEPATQALFLEILSRCSSKGVLNKTDIQNIIDGKDVTISNVDGKLVKVVSPDFLSWKSTVSDISLVVIYLSLFIVLIGLIKRI